LAIQFSTQERPWGALVLCTALACWAAIRHIARGGLAPLVACGAAAGLAFASHQAGLGILAIAGFTWMIGSRGGDAPALLSARRFRWGVVTVTAFAATGFLLGHPYLLVHGVTPVESVVGGAAVGEAGGISFGGMSLLFDFRMETLLRLAKGMVGYDPVLVFLGLLGARAAWRLRVLRPMILFALLWGGFFLTNTSDHLRYLLPLTPPLALMGGVAIQALLSGRSRRYAAPLLALLLALPLVQATRFAVVLTRPDTRAEMEEWLYRLPLGSRVAVDRYGPVVPLDWRSLETTREIRQARGSGLTTRERHRLRALNEDRIDVPEWGLDAVLIEDLFDVDTRAGTVSVRRGLEAYGSSPADVLTDLGVTHLCRVRRRMGQPSFLDGVLNFGAPLFSVDPSACDVGTVEAFLPTEMDFPLTALWTVDRPGPLLEVLPLMP
jgi:hypothetical protein